MKGCHQKDKLTMIITRLINTSWGEKEKSDIEIGEGTQISEE